MSASSPASDLANAAELRSPGQRAGFFSASFSVLVTNVCAGLLAVGTQIITARVLGPAGRGQYVLITLVTVIGATVGSVGLPPATVFFTARRTHSRRAIVDGNLFISVAVGAAIFLVGTTAVFLAPAGWIHTSRWLIVVALACIPLMLIFTSLQAVYQGENHFRTMNALSVLQTAFPLAFSSVALLGLGLHLGGAVYAYGAAVLATASVAVGLAARAGGIQFRPPWDYIKRAVKYGLQVQFNYIAAFLTYRIDMVLVAALASSVAVGYYSVSVVIAERVWLLSLAISTVLLPRIAGETSERVRQRTTAQATRATFWLSSAIALFLFAFGRELISLLFSSEFARSATALNGLLLGIVLFSVSRILVNDLAARGRPIVNAYVSYTCLAVNIGANLLLIPAYGIAGAAWSSSISYGLACLMTMVIYCRLTGSSAWKLISPTLLVSDLGSALRRRRRPPVVPDL
ncbi:MAG: flippase [Actinomycetota bacterium]|nr:flippase [Actinomycetota bacterium]